MKKHVKPYLFLVFFLLSLSITAQTYKATYKISCIQNLTNKNIWKETGFLITKANEGSIYATKNYFKRDSIRKLVSAGKISPYEVMNDNYPKTSFNNYIKKTYENQIISVPTLIVMYDYVYSQKNAIIWQLQPDTLTIKNYKCYKASTTFEGRDYVAWYSTDIPISDGPHKFWGLPGLIIKITDTENHNTFELESFEKFTDKFPEFRKPDQDFEVSYEKFKQLRKDEIENPRKALESQGIKPVGDHSILNAVKRNPIERY